MSDDRLQLPDTLEKALDAAKQQPTDWELARKRAQMWEQVSAKGRRQERWARWWKPLTGVIAAAAVVLAAVVVPSHLPNGKNLSHWTTASSPASENKGQATNAIQPAPNDTRALTNLYAQQGQQFIWHDQSSGYDLVASTQGTGKTHEVSLARNGIVHPILPIPNGKKVQPVVGMYSTAPLIGFTFVDSQTPGLGGLVEDTMYFINSDTMKVGSISVDGTQGFINQIGIWDQRPSQVTILYSQLNPNTGHEQVYSWVWSDQRDGKAKPLFSTNNEVLKAIITDAPAPVLLYPNHLYQVGKDGSIHLIDEDAKLNVTTVLGPDRKEINGLLYAVGSFPNASFGSYTGDQQLKLYSFATQSSQVLLPGVQGDQSYVSDLGNNKFLLQCFVADDPVKAQQTPLSQVPGTLQLWYVQLGQAPQLVYKKHEVGEKFLSSYYPAQYHASGYHTLMVEDPTAAQQKSALDFDWHALTVQPVTLSASK